MPLSARAFPGYPALMVGVFLHASLGLFLLVAVPALALVGLLGFFRPLPSRFYAFLRGVAWVAILQVLLGFLLFLQGLRPKDGLHLLYGLLLAAGLHYLGGLRARGVVLPGPQGPAQAPRAFRGPGASLLRGARPPGVPHGPVRASRATLSQGMSPDNVVAFCFKKFSKSFT